MSTGARLRAPGSDPRCSQDQNQIKPGLSGVQNIICILHPHLHKSIAKLLMSDSICDIVDDILPIPPDDISFGLADLISTLLIPEDVQPPTQTESTQSLPLPETAQLPTQTDPVPISLPNDSPTKQDMKQQKSPSTPSQPRIAKPGSPDSPTLRVMELISANRASAYIKRRYGKDHSEACFIISKLYKCLHKAWKKIDKLEKVCLCFQGISDL